MGTTHSHEELVELMAETDRDLREAGDTATQALFGSLASTLTTHFQVEEMDVTPLLERLTSGSVVLPHETGIFDRIIQEHVAIRAQAGAIEASASRGGSTGAVEGFLSYLAQHAAEEDAILMSASAAPAHGMA